MPGQDERSHGETYPGGAQDDEPRRQYGVPGEPATGEDNKENHSRARRSGRRHRGRSTAPDAAPPARPPGGLTDG